MFPSAHLEVRLRAFCSLQILSPKRTIHGTQVSHNTARQRKLNVAARERRLQWPGWEGTWRFAPGHSASGVSSHLLQLPEELAKLGLLPPPLLAGVAAFLVQRADSGAHPSNVLHLLLDS